MRKRMLCVCLTPTLVVVLLLFLVVAGGGCTSSRTYTGVVINAETQSPIAGVKVRGRYVLRGRFAPTLDGFFLRRSRYVMDITDSQGQFKVTLKGRSRYIKIIKTGYDRIVVYVKGTSSKYEKTGVYVKRTSDNLVIRLVPQH